MSGLDILNGILQLGVIAFFISYLVWFAYLQFLFRIKKIPPGPIGLPILGYAPFFHPNKVHEGVASLNKKYGKLFSLVISHKLFIFTSDYDVSEELLKHPCSQDRPLEISDSLPVKGAFPFLNGKEWVDERRSCMHALRNIGFGRDDWNNIVKDYAEEVADVMSKSKGKPLEFFPLLSHASVKSTLLLVLGQRDVKLLTEKDFDCATEVRPMLKFYVKIFLLLVLFPSLFKLTLKLGVMNFGRGLKKTSFFFGKIRKILKKRLEEDNYDVSRNLVQSYMKSMKIGNYSDEALDMSVDRIIQDVIIFLITNEAPLTAMRWLLLILAAKPEIQQKIHAELDEVLGKNGEAPLNNLQKLPYTMACFKETLRWSSLAALSLPRAASQSFEFHGYNIPKGCIIICNLWSAGRDPKCFDNPHEFIPERFVKNGNEKSVQAEPMSFSVGRRNCPAKQASYAMMATYGLTILRRFKVKPLFGEKPDLSRLFLLANDPVKQPLCFVERE